MVKLLKHELFALFRILIFFAGAVVVLAVAGRVLIFFSLSNSNDQFISFMAFVIVFYVIAISALAIAAYALGINRFYSTLFTGEGYLTLSLPVTPMQLIWAKLLSALIGVFFATAVSVLSLVILLAGWDAEVMMIITGVFDLYGEIMRYFMQTEPVLFAEYILLIIISLPMGLLVLYAIISVGQLFTSRRKGVTYLIGIVLYFVVSSFYSVFDEAITNYLDSISPHLTVWVEIIGTLAVEVGCFILISHILKNKVNLIT